MQRKAVKIVGFHSDSGFCAIDLEGPWKVSAGLKPNINSGTCSFAELAKLGDTPGGQVGSVEFFDFNEDTASVTIEQITLIDVEPIGYGQTPDDDDAKAVKYRLQFSDQRYGFVEPRGGRLTLGIINPSTQDSSLPSSDDDDDPDAYSSQLPAPLTMRQCIRACLDAMGVSADIPDVVDSVKAPHDLKWLGTHAPTELEKLLAIANCVFVCRLNDDLEIHPLGVGEPPVIPDDQVMPAVSLKGVDGRGKQVVFASFPTQIAIQQTSDQLHGSLNIVYPDKSGVMQKIDDCGRFGTDAIAGMNKMFAGTDAATIPHAQHACYRLLQIDPSVYSPRMQPLLRQTWTAPVSGTDYYSDKPNGLPPQLNISLKAKIAYQDSASKLWKMATDFIDVPVKQILAGNVVVCGMRLVKLKAGVTGAVQSLEGNCDKIDMDTEAQLSFSVGGAAWNDTTQNWEPEFFFTGFTGTPDAPVEMTSDEARAAMKDPATIVVPIAEMVGVRFNAGGDGPDPYNKQWLVDQCKAFAPRYLQDPAHPPKLLGGSGFINATIDGIVGEVEYDQESLSTRFHANCWFRPLNAYLATQFGRLRTAAHESHPHEASTAASRTTSGAAGSAQPSVPVNTYEDQTGRGLFAVHVTKDSGDFTPTLTATYTVKDTSDNDLPDGSNTTSTMKTPEARWASAASVFGFTEVAAGSSGVAYYDSAGALRLYSVAQEWPLAQACSDPTGGE